MEIKKTPSKVTAKRKEPVTPPPTLKTTTKKPDNVDVTKDKKTKNQTSSINKVKTDLLSQEKLKEKRERMFKEQKDKIEEKAKKGRIDARNRKVMILCAGITMLILFLFTPIYPVKDLKYINLNYLRVEDLNVEHPLENYFSPYQYIRFENEVRSGSPFVRKVNFKYNMKKMKVTVSVAEYTPLVRDQEGNVYFYHDDMVTKTNKLNVYAPVISNFDNDSLEKLLSYMVDLDYNVITQIDSIRYAPTKEDDQLLQLGMSGGHTVYIDMKQMETKLVYYSQIKQIIDKKADGKPGVIYLNEGDYYEPK